MLDGSWGYGWERTRLESWHLVFRHNRNRACSWRPTPLKSSASQSDHDDNQSRAPFPAIHCTTRNHMVTRVQSLYCSLSTEKSLKKTICRRAFQRPCRLLCTGKRRGIHQTKFHQRSQTCWRTNWWKSQSRRRKVSWKMQPNKIKKEISSKDAIWFRKRWGSTGKPIAGKETCISIRTE